MGTFTAHLPQSQLQVLIFTQLYETPIEVWLDFSVYVTEYLLLFFI